MVHSRMCFDPMLRKRCLSISTCVGLWMSRRSRSSVYAVVESVAGSKASFAIGVSSVASTLGFGAFDTASLCQSSRIGSCVSTLFLACFEGGN